MAIEYFIQRGDSLENKSNAIGSAPPGAKPGGPPGPPPVSKSQKIVGLVAVIVSIAIFFLPLPLDTIGKITFSLTIWLLVWLIATPIESGHTSLIYIALLLLIGYPSSQIFTMLMINPGWFQIASFVIAAAMMRSGLARRLSYLIMCKLRANTVRRFMIASIFISLLLIFIIPSPISLMAILMPIMIYCAEAWKIPSRNEAGKKGVPLIAMLSFLLVIFGGLAGFWIKTGFSQNLITLQIAQIDIPWIKWLLLAGPPTWICAFILVVLCIIIWKPDKNIEAPMSMLEDELKKMGKLSGTESRLIILMVVIVLCWITESIHHIQPGWIAICGVCIMAIPRFGLFKSFGDTVSTINWPLIFFQTALLAMVNVLASSGINAMIASWFAGVKPATATGYYAFSALMGTFGTSILGVNAIQGVFVPMFMQWGQALGIGQAQSLLAIWLPAGLGGSLIPTLLPSVLFAWTFKYKGERMFTVKDGFIVALVLFAAYYIAAALCQLVYWGLI